MASTPPPPNPERLHTPPTPLHGAKYDAWEPYSPPRRSSRVIGKRTQTLSSPHDSRRTLSTATATPAPRKRTLSHQVSSQTLSPPSSPETSQSRSKIASATTYRAAQDAHPTGSLDTSLQGTSSGSAAMETSDAALMFPTPRKTPRKLESTSRASTARVLHFKAQAEDVFSSSRKRRQRITLDSPENSPSGSGIQVHIDSQDRIPEMEHSEHNPFVGPRRVTRTNPRVNSRRQNREEAAMDEAVKNGEGLIYVFRGRKMFRKFADASNETHVESPDLHNMVGQTTRIRHNAGASAHRPITRSTLQPRLLFPSADHRPSNEEADEEAITDIEDETEHCRDPCADGTLSFKVVEPESSEGVHVGSRSALDETPVPDTVGKGKTKKPSPFDSWPRQKSGAAKNPSQGTKRSAADPVQSTGAKRTRSSTHNM